MPEVLSAAFYGLSTVLAYKAARVLQRCYPYILPTPALGSGKYVIVSGCTDGIGMAFARYLDKKNIPLVLIGRN